MVTLKEIANVCGVSVATVSKALNHASDISHETTERVARVARELGYYPNAAARQLKTNRSYNIGVLFVDETHCGLTHEYFSSVLNAVKNEVEHRGYDVTFISKNIGTTAMTYLEHARYRNCDGVIIASVDFTEQDVLDLVNSEVPVVTIDYIFDNHSAVLSDNVKGVKELVEYAYNLGHRKIAFVHGEATAVTRSRLASFHKTCLALGIDVPEGYVQPARYHDPHLSGQATRRLLELDVRPTCILYPDDISQMGGVTEMERQGLKVPDDISVIGYDGILLSRVLRPMLTTMSQDSVGLGSQAAKLLIEAIEDPKTYIPQLLMIPGHLQTGGTVRDLNRHK